MAEIIPFPRPPAPANEPARLSNALTSLARAMADQRAAVAVWRSSVQDLAAEMQVLSDNLAASQFKAVKRN